MFYRQRQLLSVYTEYLPARCLREQVACYWTSVPTGLGAPETVVPDGCIDLVLSLDRVGGGVRMVIAGPMERPAQVDLGHSRWESFGIRFAPGGLHAFLREPAHRFTGRMELLADVSPRLAGCLTAVLERRPVDERVSAADRLLASMLGASAPWEATFRNAACALADGRPVRAVAQREAVSERHLQRLFLERVGLSPKQFSRIARFQEALRQMQTGGKPLADVAQVCGYYDQAHLTREFGSLAGLNPTAYLSDLSKTGGRPGR